MQTVEGRWANYAVLINPILAANGAIMALFGETAGRGGVLGEASLPPEAFAAAVAAYGILFTLLLLTATGSWAHEHGDDESARPAPAESVAARARPPSSCATCRAGTATWWP